MGLLPDVVAKRLGLAIPTNHNHNDTKEKETICTAGEKSSCCNDDTAVGRTTESTSLDADTDTDTDTVMHEITEANQFKNLLAHHQLVFVKFTAEWCKPCKQIQPHFYKLASEYKAAEAGASIAFTTVDVDELDEVAANYKVAMMPTFVAIRRGETVATMSGANEDRLEIFIKEAVEASASSS